MILLYPQWIPVITRRTAGPEIRRTRPARQRSAPRVDARSGERVRLPRQRAAGRTGDRRRFPMALSGEHASRPRHDHAGDARPAVERRGAVSGRLFRARHHRRAERCVLPDGWQYRHGARNGRPRSGAITTFKPVTLRTLVDSPVFAGRYFKRVRPRSRRPGAGPPRHRRRPRAICSSVKPEAARGAPRAGAAGLQAVRLAPLRPLRFPVLADRPDGRHRPRAPSLQRGRHDRRLLHRLGRRRFTGATCCRTSTPIRGTASSAAPPTSGRRTSTCRCATACCGSTRARPSTGATCSRRARGCGPGSRRSTRWPRPRPTYDHRVGRNWRAMEDTTNDPIIAHRRPQSWRSWQRSEDYYSEGQLIWLDADTLIRERSHGQQIARRFRPRLLRHRRRQLRHAHLHVRRCGRRAERRRSPTTGRPS